MFSLIDTPIQTERSFFKIYEFSDHELVKNSIEEAKDKLNKTMSRSVGFFSDTVTGFYRYGPIKLTEIQTLTPSLSSLLNDANDQFATDFNGILVNEYKTGANYIEKHRDSRNHPDVGVVIISYGATRNFRIYDKYGTVKVLDVPLIENQAIHMGGDFQLEFMHDVEPDKNITETRYSLSYHKFLNLGLYRNPY
jgi:alkylated DNA repair dioxygenase AlkB